MAGADFGAALTSYLQEFGIPKDGPGAGVGPGAMAAVMHYAAQIAALPKGEPWPDNLASVLLVARMQDGMMAMKSKKEAESEEIKVPAIGDNGVDEID